MTRVAFAVLTLLLAACETAAPPPPPVVAPPSVAPAPPTAPESVKPVDVLLIPVGNLPPSIPQYVVDRLGPELGLEIRTSLAMGDGDLAPIPGTQQLAAEDVIARAHDVGARYPYRNERSIVIALTARDINARARTTRFVFAQNEPTARTSVLSVARLVYDTKTGGATTASPEVVSTRVYKMTKRIVGEQLLGLQRSSDIHDSLEDVDAMGSDFAHRDAAPPRVGLSLPKPPAGYAWRPVEELRGAVLVPDGWHYLKDLKPGTVAVFVTQQKIGAQGYETGVALNAYVGNPSAPARVKQILDRMAADHATKLAAGSKGFFATLQCEYDSPREKGLEAVHMIVLGIHNTRTNATYLLTFESPLSEWRAAWTRAQPIFSMLALDREL
jgi:predicted Zn-dependent protease